MAKTMTGLLTCIVSAGLGLCVVPGTAKAEYYYAGCMQSLVQRHGWKYQEADYLCRCGAGTGWQWILTRKSGFFLSRTVSQQ